MSEKFEKTLKTGEPFIPETEEEVREAIWFEQEYIDALKDVVVKPEQLVRVITKSLEEWKKSDRELQQKIKEGGGNWIERGFVTPHLPAWDVEAETKPLATGERVIREIGKITNLGFIPVGAEECDYYRVQKGEKWEYWRRNQAGGYDKAN